MTESDYQINELAKKAGVSVRTIRFYIDEGLLPSPPSQGRYAVYSEDHLERLELIRLLKDKFLPLKEIRMRLSGISQEDVRAAIAHEKGTAEQTDPSRKPPPARPHWIMSTKFSRVSQGVPSLHNRQKETSRNPSKRIFGNG
jgi:DNA-binding transcriptional MerR regulator